MRILKVWDSEYPWDVRAEKISKALTQMGHEVHLVARNRTQRPLRERLEECTVHRMPSWGWAGRRLDAVSQFPAFFNPRWIKLLRGIAKEHQADLILVRDLPLAPTAVYVGRSMGIPVVLDMAEHYAAMMRDLWQTNTTKFGDSLVRNPKIVEAVERWVLRHVDHTLVVVEESKERLIASGLKSDKVSVVGNTPSIERFRQFAQVRTSQASRSPRSDAVSLVYLGLMEEARGVRQVIQAVGANRACGVNVTLDLIGEGRSLSSFRSTAAQLGLGDDAVRFHGFLPYQEALATVASMDAGLIPHFASESWESTIPNKLFDYMSLGLPVISSDVSPVVRVLEETQAGVVFRDRDLDDLTRVIRLMCHNSDRVGMGENGLRAIRDRYHFERDATVMGQVLENVACAR